VHWHGLRLENKYDGVPHETQAPIPVGGRFTYRIQFPDAGLYWYHPHIREDYTQELGLYGNILVEPAEPGYWPSVDRDFVVTVDDLLVEDNKIAPFSPTETTYAAMGRFGNVFLTSGDPDLHLEARAGEVVRLWLTNTANTRVFNLTVPGARMKLVGGDSGRVEHEEFIDQVLLAPSERAVVDVLVERPGELALEHHTPERTYRLARITVTDERAAPSVAAGEFEVLGRAPELAAERRHRWLAAPPDKVLALVAQMDDPAAMPASAGPVTYACPMHPEVTNDQPGRCPKCGMKLLATQAPAAPSSYVCPMHPEVTSDEPGRCPKCGMKLLAAEGVPKPAAAAAAATMEDHGGTLVATTTARGPAPPTVSSGKTTWSRSTGSPPPPPCTGGSWTGPAAPTARPSTGTSRWASGSSSGWSTRWILTIPCTIPSICMAPAGSWSWPAMGFLSRTWSGRTPCWSAPARSWTSCSTSPTPGCGWPIATSPSTCRAA
jgi:FtsP/CotA-like multicopper oxidase with cupredoxin domain